MEHEKKLSEAERISSKTKKPYSQFPRRVEHAAVRRARIIVPISRIS
jgi:hypothetical protein